MYSRFRKYLPLEKGGALYLNKLESLPPKNALCQVWLKLAQWFWRGRLKCEKFTTNNNNNNDNDDGQRTDIHQKSSLEPSVQVTLKWVHGKQGALVTPEVGSGAWIIWLLDWSHTSWRSSRSETDGQRLSRVVKWWREVWGRWERDSIRCQFRSKRPPVWYGTPFTPCWSSNTSSKEIYQKTQRDEEYVLSTQVITTTHKLEWLQRAAYLPDLMVSGQLALDRILYR